MSLIKGKKVEQEFKQFFLKKDYVESIVDATKDQDVNEHWDLKVVFKDKNVYYYDVKGVKRVSRQSELDDSIHWVELKNVKGKDGWINGKATHFVFETFNS